MQWWHQHSTSYRHSGSKMDSKRHTKSGVLNNSEAQMGNLGHSWIRSQGQGVLLCDSWFSLGSWSLHEERRLIFTFRGSTFSCSRTVLPACFLPVESWESKCMHVLLSLCWIMLLIYASLENFVGFLWIFLLDQIQSTVMKIYLYLKIQPKMWP